MSDFLVYYIVICKSKRGNRVLATRQMFSTPGDALIYAEQCDKEAEPEIIEGRFHEMRTPDRVAERYYRKEAKTLPRPIPAALPPPRKPPHRVPTPFHDETYRGGSHRTDRPSPLDLNHRPAPDDTVKSGDKPEVPSSRPRHYKVGAK